MLIAIVLLFLIIIFLCYKYSKLQKNYNRFMKKVGNGENIQEDLENFMYKVDKVEKQNAEILGNCTELSNELEKCIQKIYNACENS